MNSYTALEKFLCWEAIILLAAAFAAIVHQVLTRRINLAGLFDVHDGSGNTSPTRIQLLLFTVAYGLYFLIQTFHSPTCFPTIPHETLYLLGGSHGAYLSAKGYLNSQNTSAL